MRMNLYSAEILGSHGTMMAYVTAPTTRAAIDFIKDHEKTSRRRVTRISVTRVDDQMPEQESGGLGQLLRHGPTGFASRHPTIGWFIHGQVHPEVQLFSVQRDRAQPRFVLAPNADVAMAIEFWSKPTEAPQTKYAKVALATSLTDRQKHEIEELIEFGVIGMLAWDEKRGWSVT
ncbi:hypothetical protein [Qipengyuania oceanensis]|uniref:Uncharacterized protein n=1 Tax=Qipengyuania oceanensis TaxID=1463597 RepID=A0A844YCU5_9SPHN|nr:hypothetical protein [Qipengyuania oceanensis]MXO61393.1 hypothetical protein [Qipengyuania oceanensis]